MDKYDVIIVGGGPAGLTSGLYTSRAGLKSLLVERGVFGGQMVNTRAIENYPGFPDGVSGSDLGTLMHEQAAKFGLRTLFAEVDAIIPGPMHRVSTSEGDFEATAVIVAAGSRYQNLDVPGEKTFAGRGVSYCATCDGFFFRGREVAVVGGGDTAVTDALDLAEIAQKVYLIHRRDQLRAGKVLQERIFAQPKIQFIWNTVVEEVIGDQMMNALKLRNVRTGTKSTLQVNGVFVAVGVMPNSQFLADTLKVEVTGHIVTDEHLAASVPGIYAAGDIRRNSPKQIASAVGDGVTAALSVLRYIQDRG